LLKVERKKWVKGGGKTLMLPSVGNNDGIGDSRNTVNDA
jgi:hypothetical protein